MLTKTQIDFLKTLQLDPNLPKNELKKLIEQKLEELQDSQNVEQDLNLETNSLLQESDQNYTGRSIVGQSEKNPEDFALWKFVDESSLQKWRFADFEEVAALYKASVTSPHPKGMELADSFSVGILWRWGSPGWHSECVAMICNILSKKEDKQEEFSFSRFIAKHEQKSDLQSLKSAFEVLNLEKLQMQK